MGSHATNATWRKEGLRQGGTEGLCRIPIAASRMARRGRDRNVGPTRGGALRFERVARGTICQFELSDAAMVDYVFGSIHDARLGATESGSRGHHSAGCLAKTCYIVLHGQFDAAAGRRLPRVWGNRALVREEGLRNREAAIGRERRDDESYVSMPIYVGRYCLRRSGPRCGAAGFPACSCAARKGCTTNPRPAVDPLWSAWQATRGPIQGRMRSPCMWRLTGARGRTRPRRSVRLY
jgi:hypothetical protein